MSSTYPRSMGKEAVAARWRRVRARLREHHGDPFAGGLPLGNKEDPFDEAVYIQLTYMTRSQRCLDEAFDALRREVGSSGWGALLSVAEERVRDIVTPLGLVERRTANLLALVAVVEEKHDGDLRHLATLDPDDALAQLERLPGLGPKGARCVGAYSLGLPYLAVDVHVLRVAKRLGFASRELTWARAHGVLESQVPAGLRRELHALLVIHGRLVCSNRSPGCSGCVLRRSCPEAGQAAITRSAYVPELAR